jgi:hypothetical protein
MSALVESEILFDVMSVITVDLGDVTQKQLKNAAAAPSGAEHRGPKSVFPQPVAWACGAARRVEWGAGRRGRGRGRRRRRPCQCQCQCRRDRGPGAACAECTGGCRRRFVACFAIVLFVICWFVVCSL